MATFANDPRVIHKTRKRFTGGLTVRKNRDASASNIVDEDSLSRPVNGLKHAAVVRQMERNVQVQFPRVDTAINPIIEFKASGIYPGLARGQPY